MEEVILRLPEVAEFLGVHENTIYKMLAKHEIPGFQLAGRWRFRKSTLITWLEKRESGYDAPSHPRQKGI